MDRIIRFYLKLFATRAYAEEFCSGRLLLRPLRYFKDLESAPDRRGDKHEAVSRWYQPADIRVEIGGIPIPSSDIAAPLVFQEQAYDETRVLCLYAGTAPFEGTLEQLESELRIPDEAFEMGEWAALVHSPKQFQQRFLAACRRDNRNGKGKLVRYFDPQTYSGSLEDPIFWKKKEYSHQREYRFALRPIESDPEMLFFDVGDLSDIAVVTPADALKQISVRPK